MRTLAVPRLTLFVVSIVFAIASAVPVPSGSAKAHDANQVSLPPIKPASVSGHIKMGGVATLALLNQKIAEQFKADGFSGNIVIVPSTSGAHVEAFCKGEVDIVGINSELDPLDNPNQTAGCKKNGIVPITFTVALNALSVVVSRQNRFIDSLNQEQLFNIFSGKSKTWKEVNAKWPDQKIRVLSEMPRSGSYDFLTDVLFRPVWPDHVVHDKVISSVPGIKMSADVNLLSKEIYGSLFTIGYFDFTFYAQNRSRLRAVAFAGVMPTTHSVADGRYPLSRPLMLVTSAKTLKDKPQVNAFVNYYLMHASALTLDAGYFPAATAALDKAKREWQNAQK
jgi:phosphate binding protein